MRFTPETRAWHARLSQASCRFLDFVERTPACLDRREFAALGPGDGLFSHGFQPWPTFVGPRRVGEMAAAGVGVSSLIKGLCERVFQGDPARLAAFYGIGLERAVRLVAALRDPIPLQEIIGRGDFLDTPGGLKCMEFNLCGNLGGWQSKLWAPRFMGVPLIARFCAEAGIACSSRDTLRSFLLHVARGAAAAGTEGGWNLALLAPPDFQDAQPVQRLLDAELRQVLAEVAPGSRGRVWVCRPEQVRELDGVLWLGDQRLHAVAEQYQMEYDARMFACLGRGDTRFFNGPLRLILDDKRNLALLSEQLEGARYSPEEKRLIAAHVPWTRRVHSGVERFAGEVVPLPELLAGQREKLVLKRALGYGGTGIHLGIATPASRWDELVRQALAADDWVVQEWLQAVPYVYQAGAFGCAPYDVVWGLFVFGGSYAGTFLRMLPQGWGGVINTAGGAIEGIVFEVDE